MQQTYTSFYKYRFLLAGMLAIACLVLFSALVTALGSHTVLDPTTKSAVLAESINTSEDTNVVADGLQQLLASTQRGLLATGRSFYSACQSVTNAAAQSGGVTVHGGAVVVSGIGDGAAIVGDEIGTGATAADRGMGSGIVATLRVPRTLAMSVTHSEVVSTVVRPRDKTAPPVISAETSAAALAHLNAQQQQEIASLQSAQLAANQALDGTVVAGDPNHGGYPARWDAPVAQDSRLDSWGMYNRECVSYAAWKVYQTFGHMPYWGGVGNANQWVRDAQAASIPTGPSPRVHAVAISQRGYYGHAMWVEAVKGTMIYVSQYNYNLQGGYSEMWVDGSAFTYVYFS